MENRPKPSELTQPVISAELAAMIKSNMVEEQSEKPEATPVAHDVIDLSAIKADSDVITIPEAVAAPEQAIPVEQAPTSPEVPAQRMPQYVDAPPLILPESKEPMAPQVQLAGPSSPVTIARVSTSEQSATGLIPNEGFAPEIAKEPEAFSPMTSFDTVDAPSPIFDSIKSAEPVAAEPIMVEPEAIKTVEAIVPEAQVAPDITLETISHESAESVQLPTSIELTPDLGIAEEKKIEPNPVGFAAMPETGDPYKSIITMEPGQTVEPVATIEPSPIIVAELPNTEPEIISPISVAPEAPNAKPEGPKNAELTATTETSADILKLDPVIDVFLSVDRTASERAGIIESLTGTGALVRHESPDGVVTYSASSEATQRYLDRLALPEQVYVEPEVEPTQQSLPKTPISEFDAARSLLDSELAGAKPGEVIPPLSEFDVARNLIDSELAGLAGTKSSESVPMTQNEKDAADLKAAKDILNTRLMGEKEPEVGAKTEVSPKTPETTEKVPGTIETLPHIDPTEHLKELSKQLLGETEAQTGMKSPEQMAQLDKHLEITRTQLAVLRSGETRRIFSKSKMQSIENFQGMYEDFYKEHLVQQIKAGLAQVESGMMSEVELKISLIDALATEKQLMSKLEKDALADRPGSKFEKMFSSHPKIRTAIRVGLVAVGAVSTATGIFAPVGVVALAGLSAMSGTSAFISSRKAMGTAGAFHGKGSASTRDFVGKNDIATMEQSELYQRMSAMQSSDETATSGLKRTREKRSKTMTELTAKIRETEYLAVMGEAEKGGRPAAEIMGNLLHQRLNADREQIESDRKGNLKRTVAASAIGAAAAGLTLAGGLHRLGGHPRGVRGLAPKSPAKLPGFVQPAHVAPGYSGDVSVKPGDSLWKIGAKALHDHDPKWGTYSAREQLIKTDRLKDLLLAAHGGRSLIMPGQHIKIPNSLFANAVRYKQ